MAGDSEVSPPVVPSIPVAAGEIAGVPRISKRANKSKKKKKSPGKSVPVTPSVSGAEGAEGAAQAPALPAAVSSSNPPLPQNSEGVSEAKSKRTRQKSRKLVEAEASKSKPRSQVNLVCDVPLTYRQAKQSPQWPQWRTSMQEEIDSLEALDTWELCPRDHTLDTLHCKWVYRIKTSADGNVERFKSRIVACGNEQVYGKHYLIKFSPTLSMSTGYFILGLSIKFGVRPQHGDIPNAYVHATLNFVLMMEIPAGIFYGEEILKSFGVTKQNQLVFKLKKSLYGLKQAGRLWNELLNDHLVKIGFVRSFTDPCLYYKRDQDGLTIVGVYVDDLLVTGTAQARVDDFFNQMAPLNVILGNCALMIILWILYIANGFTVSRQMLMGMWKDSSLVLWHVVTNKFMVNII